MTPEQLADEIDQLWQSYRIQQKTIARLNSEIGDLQTALRQAQDERTRLLEVIRLQAAAQPGTVKNKRLYKFSGSTKLYLKDDCESYTQDRRHAGLFSEEEWLEWGQESGLQKEAIGEDEQMKLVGAPTLPGLEL